MDSTIAGIATAPGEGGIAILRLSGPKAQEIFESVFRAALCRPPYPDHLLMYGKVMDGDETVDEVMGVVMLSPKTYTREDVCEIHAHGGNAVAARILRLLLRKGAQAAAPGEFTRRAFVNGRIDLMQAEAVMGVIGARSGAALRSEERLLAGGQSGFVKEMQTRLLSLLSGLEAHIDYPDEISEEEAVTGLSQGLSQLIKKLEAAVNLRSARIIREGLHVAVFGRPNAGKSTLFNALVGEERAIVSAIPGTTRDVIDGSFSLDGYNIFLRDTAGLRESSDPVEAIGVSRARKTISDADAGLLLLDASSPLSEEDEELLSEKRSCPCAVLLNKEDERMALSVEELEKRTELRPIFAISAKMETGLEQIRDYFRSLIGKNDEELLTHERHMQLAGEACERLKSALAVLGSGQPIDLAAVDMHEALFLLGRITGENVDEALLDDIFSRFCVGK